MGADQLQDWHRTAASALEWWRDAGVDMLVEDTPRDWLARPEPTHEPQSDPVKAEPVAEAALPDTLADFLAWRTGPEAPEAGWGMPIVAPNDAPGAALMIITDMPEAGDAGSGTLLSGAPGRLLDRMLAAIAVERGAVHLTALALARPATGRIPPDREARLAEIARHHLGLAAPQRVLLLGQTTSRALLGVDAARQPGRLHAINHGGRQWPVMASFHPRFLLDRPAAKADSWRDLQLIREGFDT